MYRTLKLHEDMLRFFIIDLKQFFDNHFLLVIELLKVKIKVIQCRL